jgi:uncharacterized protein (DUF1810 family)
MVVLDPFKLQRFVEAQKGVIARVCAELTAGRKESHWMWFIFPQLKGLGSSATARHYAIGSLDEARAYLAHPVLGPRLRECTGLVNRVEGRSIEAIFGYPDHLKFRSCMTLFARAADDAAAGGVAHAAGDASATDEAQPFREALQKYFAGEGDPLTLELLTSAS